MLFTQISMSSQKERIDLYIPRVNNNITAILLTFLQVLLEIHLVYVLDTLAQLIPTTTL